MTLIHSTCATVLVLILLTGIAMAQSGRGTISGRLLDATGAVVSLADVSALNQETGVLTATQSNDQGQYVVLNLAVGTYTVEVKKTGFTPFLRKDLSVSVQSAITVDATLSVGSLSDTVKVTAGASALQFRSP